jgi:putative ABC transport system permease protein
MFNESIKMAIDGMISNKLRTLLTLLGIIIGVGAVIAMVSLGFGVKEQVKNNISSLGSNLLIVMSGGRTASGARLAAGQGARLTAEDAYAIEKQIDCLYCPGCFFILSISCRQPKLDCQC